MKLSRTWKRTWVKTQFLLFEVLKRLFNWALSSSTSSMAIFSAKSVSNTFLNSCEKWLNTAETIFGIIYCALILVRDGIVPPFYIFSTDVFKHGQFKRGFETSIHMKLSSTQLVLICMRDTVKISKWFYFSKMSIDVFPSLDRNVNRTLMRWAAYLKLPFFSLRQSKQ